MSNELLMRSPATLWRNVGETVVVAQPGREDFDELSPTAATAWRLLESPRTLPELVHILARTYDTPADSIQEQVRVLIEDLIRRGALMAVADAED